MSTKTKAAAMLLSAVTVIPGAVALAGGASAAPTSGEVTHVRIATTFMWTTAKVNVRSGPGTDFAIVRTLSAGTRVNVVETRAGWSCISSGGWIRSDLLSTSQSLDDPTVLYRIRTNTTAKLRKGPGTDYAVTRTVPAGTTFSVVNTKRVWSDELQDTVTWEQVASGGWIRGDLTDGI